MFVEQKKWNRRGVKTSSITTKDGKPFLSVSIGDSKIRKKWLGDWAGTTTNITGGKTFKISNKINLKWEQVSDLSPFEITSGELKHLAEFGADISSLEVSQLPAGLPAVVSYTHEIEFSKGSKVDYQGELTQDEIEIMHATRPPAIVGSYAVFDKEGMKYAHIPRPIARDGSKYVWGTIDLTYVKTEVRDGEEVDVYTSTVSFKKSDLQSLATPFTIYGLDTIGYTGLGGTDYYNALMMSNGYHTPASNGTVDNVRIYGKMTTSTTAVTHGVYLNGGGANNDPTTRILVTSAGNVTTTPGWWIFNAAGESIVATSSYYVASVANSSSDAIHIYGDNTGALLLRYGGTTYPCPSPFGTITYRFTSYRFSMYATYTASGSSVIKTYQGTAVASVKTLDGVAYASRKTTQGVA